MANSTFTSKGSTTIPQDIRVAAGLKTYQGETIFDLNIPAVMEYRVNTTNTSKMI